MAMLLHKSSILWQFGSFLHAPAAGRGHQRRAHLRSAAAAHMLIAVPSEKGVGVALSELCSDSNMQCQLEQCRLDLDCVVLADGVDEIQWNPPCNVWQKYSFGIFWHAIIESAGLRLNYILTSASVAGFFFRLILPGYLQRPFVLAFVLALGSL